MVIGFSGIGSSQRLPSEAVKVTGGTRELYVDLSCGKQKSQKRSDAQGPSRFVVLGALHALVVQVATELPALLQEHVAKLLDVRHDAWPLPRADIQPDTRARTDLRCRGKS